jgi:hypothetical protein
MNEFGQMMSELTMIFSATATSLGCIALVAIVVEYTLRWRKRRRVRRCFVDDPNWHWVEGKGWRLKRGSKHK